MDSDDDYNSFPQPETSLPSPRIRKLKRLKKSMRVSEDPVINSVPAVDGSNSEPVESPEYEGADAVSVEPMRFEDESVEVDEETRSAYKFGVSHVDEDRQTVKRVLGFDGEVEVEGGEVGGDDSDNFKAPGDNLQVSGEKEKKAMKRAKIDGDEENMKRDESGFGVSHVDEDRSRVKRVLDFNVVDGEGEDEGGDNYNESLTSGEGDKKAKKKNKRVKIDGDEEKFKETKSNKRAEAKERKEYLNHLHAESQRLLRETREASFKPAPVVQKPISSVLAKIRQRKLELSRKNFKHNFSSHENDDSSRDTSMEPDLEISPTRRVDDKIEEVVTEETSMDHARVGRSLGAPDSNESIESTEDMSREHVPTPVVLDEESKHLFRAPLEDTQDIYSENQSSDSKEEQPSKQDKSFVEEDFAPSLVALNLKLDSASAPLDDTSSFSDEGENDKENMSPRALGLKLSSFPNGDPVKAFVDEEAIEEDDSDNDLSRFKDTEEDDIGDAEDLKDLIATACEEKPGDNERRHELHMKWLEQQDAFGTDKLWQKLGCGSKYAETTLLQEEDDMEEDKEESSGEDTEDQRTINGARMTASKLNQMIPQMFDDKDDVYISSDDEETEKILVKQRLLKKAEIQAKFLSPLDYVDSTEVFGLIKKLNIVPETKKKAKPSAYVDMMSAKTIISSAKSSFLGKASNSSLSTSHKRVSSTMRSYIFGRDDSNSRSSIVSEDSSDTVQKEVVHATKTFSAKFSNSQSKSSQNTKSPAEMISGTSLFDILRQPQQKNTCDQEDANVGPAQSIFASFKLSNKSIKKR